jgi:Type IV secretion system pilin
MVALTQLLETFAACSPKMIKMVPTWYKYLNSKVEGGKCTPMFGFENKNDVVRVLLAVFEIILFIGGVAAVFYVVYGGFLYITSSGEPDKARNGRTTIINAIVGLFICLSATAIVNLVGRNV